MKTVRFASLVERGGNPDTHLLFSKPETDKVLQKAIRTKRVVTVYQSSVGNKADHGEVGFRPGPSRQYLIFPRSIETFNGRKVVGIKYELLRAEPIPTPKQAARLKQAAKKKTDRTMQTKGKGAPARTLDKESDPVPPEKLAKFPVPPQPEPEDEVENEAIEELKSQVRKAMIKLEKGNPVAAFNLLKRIVAD